MAERDEELSAYRRRAEREREARRAAERLLEERAQKLWSANAELERQVGVRTAELVRARDEALAASRARGEFLANMSHEIRTPMNAVMGMAELLLMEKLPEPVQDGLRVIQRASTGLLGLLNDILDLSKVEAGLLELRPVDFDVRVVVAGVLELLDVRARGRPVSLKAEVDPGVPTVAQGDDKRLRQVLVNLVGNALKFTEEGSITVKVCLVDESPGRVQLEFRVRDTGPGIAPEHRESVFGQFEQIDGSVTRRHGGTGLGLAISKRLVELLGGEIGVDSALGQGATFWFTAWLDVEPNWREVKPQPTPEPTVSALRGGPIGGRARILVVDDSPVNRMITSRLIEKAGHEVATAEDGAEAVAAVCHSSFDLVFMDVQMPRVGGVEATEQIRERERALGGRVPIVGLSAHALSQERDRCLAAGMDGYLCKPTPVADLLATIQQILAESRASRSTASDEIRERLAAPEVTEILTDDPLVIRQVAATFIEGAAELMAELHRAGRDRDWDAAAAVCHRLKGSAIGALRPSVHRCAVEAERLAHARDDGLVDAVKRLRLEVRALVDGLSAYLKSAA